MSFKMLARFDELERTVRGIEGSIVTIAEDIRVMREEIERLKQQDQQNARYRQAPRRN